MAAVRGIFSISDAIFLKKNNYWSDLAQVWINTVPNVVNTGYFVSGTSTVSRVSNVDKILYSTDTTSSSVSSFVPARTSHSTLGSLENGYIFGGFQDSPSISTSYKLSFSTDVTSLNPLMTFTEVDSTATGNTTSGYIAGGQSKSAISKVTYSTDTLAPSTSFLTNNRYSFAATGSETAGYFSGGSPGPLTSTDKLTYSTDNVLGVPGASLYFSSVESTASGNSTAGYNGNSFSAAGRTRLCKIIYSTDTTNGGSTILYNARSIQSTGSSESGYFGGGNNTSVIPSVSVTTMNKLSYSTDTMQNLVSGRLSSGRYNTVGVSARNNSLNIWRRFSDETTTTNSSPLPPVTSTSQTVISSFTPLSLNVGYFGGGRFSTNFSTMDKLNYATDTTEPVPNANLSAARYGLAATGNSIAGYFGGGEGLPGPAGSSIMDKLTYSTDTTVSSPAGSFTDGSAWTYSATGNSTAGYFAGGRIFTPAPSFIIVSSIYKITYGGDLLFRIPASLSIARQYLAATGNSTAGYFGGGEFPSPSVFSTIDKLTYSTDTRTTLPASGFLSGTRRLLAATGNSTAGYFGGGQQPFSGVSIIDTLTYSTDTREAVPGISLTTSRSSISATGNSTAGYFSTDKITYASNTVTPVPTAALSINRSQYGASSPRANALPENIPTPVFV